MDEKRYIQMLRRKIYSIYTPPVIFFLLVFAILIVKFSYLDSVPELFPGGHKIGTVVETVLGGALSSVFFHIFFNCIPINVNLLKFSISSSFAASMIKAKLKIFSHKVSGESVAQLISKLESREYVYNQMQEEGGHFEISEYFKELRLLLKFRTAIRELCSSLDNSLNFLEKEISAHKISDMTITEIISTCRTERQRLYEKTNNIRSMKEINRFCNSNPLYFLESFQSLQNYIFDNYTNDKKSLNLTVHM